MKSILCIAVSALIVLAAPQRISAQPSINSKNFSLDCRQLRGDSQRGIVETKQRFSGFTIVLSDATHAYYNGGNGPGLRYWVVRGDVAQLRPFHKPIAAFATKRQTAQLYGPMQPGETYTIFITAGDPQRGGTAARTVVKGHKCVPYVEPGIIPNELDHDRILHMG
jgi:hypothetical protein